MSERASPPSGGLSPSTVSAIEHYETQLTQANFDARAADRPRTNRAHQLDATFMEDEVVEELLSTVSKIAQPVVPSLLQRFRPELNLLLRGIIFRYTVYLNKPSIGCQLQGLVYATSASNAAKAAVAEATLEAAVSVIDAQKSPAHTHSTTGVGVSARGPGTLTKRQILVFALLSLVCPWVRVVLPLLALCF